MGRRRDLCLRALPDRDPRPLIVRHRPRGPTRPSFGTDGRAVLPAGVGKTASGELGIAATPGGGTAILLGGVVGVIGPEGRPDAAFGQNGSVVLESLVGPDFVADSIAVDQAGRILVAGTMMGAKFTGAPGEEFEKPAESAAVLRLTQDGALDSSFGSGGIASFTFGFKPPTEMNTYTGTAPEVSFSGVTVSPDGRPVLTGLGTTSWSGARDLFTFPVTRNGTPFVARLTEDGTADPSFGGAGIVEGEPFTRSDDPVAGLLGRVAYRHLAGNEGSSDRIGTAEESGVDDPDLGGGREQAYMDPALGPDGRIYVLQLSPVHEWGEIGSSRRSTCSP